MKHILIIFVLLLFVSCSNSNDISPPADEVTNPRKLIVLDTSCIKLPDSCDFKRTGPGSEYNRFRRNGLIGFCDSAGNIVIQPVFKEAQLFNEGLSAGTVYGRYGYFSPEGLVDQEPLFEYTGSFRNGLSAVKMRNKYGFFNRKFDLVIKPKFFWADEFSEGFCVVKDSLGKYEYIDTTGQLVTKYHFDDAKRFKNGKSLARKGKEWFMINRNTIRNWNNNLLPG
jgi:hypothetical protein